MSGKTMLKIIITVTVKTDMKESAVKKVRMEKMFAGKCSQRAIQRAVQNAIFKGKIYGCDYKIIHLKKR